MHRQDFVSCGVQRFGQGGHFQGLVHRISSLCMGQTKRQQCLCGQADPGAPSAMRAEV